MKWIALTVVLVGCGVDTRNIDGEPDPEVDAGAGGAGGRFAMQGSGGASGAPEVAAITQADVLACELWPLCPEGVIAPRSTLSKVSARCGVGGYACTICRDTRGGQCKDFVGRCRAPNTSVGHLVTGPDPAPSDCEKSVDQPEPSFVRCTGADLIDVVCGDAPWPT